MIRYLQARRATKRACTAYEMAVLESLIAANQRELERLAELKECRYCLATEDDQQRERCAR